MTCARCHYPICGCPDAVYAGTVVIDDPDRGGSEPGSWAQHLRDTEAMRDPRLAAPCHTSGAATQHGRARFVSPLERN